MKSRIELITRSKSDSLIYPALALQAVEIKSALCVPSNAVCHALGLYNLPWPSTSNLILTKNVI